MKIASLLALYNFPVRYARHCVLPVAEMSDEVFVRLDMRGDRQAQAAMLDLLGDKVRAVIEMDEEWNWWNFREELLAMASLYRPDVCLFFDEDELPDATLREELGRFYASDKDGMMFDYHAPLPTDDGVTVEGGLPYPANRMMKAFRWRPGLTYQPYRGYTRVTNYADPDCHWLAETKISHYALYTAELRARHRMNR